MESWEGCWSEPSSASAPSPVPGKAEGAGRPSGRPSGLPRRRLRTPKGAAPNACPRGQAARSPGRKSSGGEKQGFVPPRFGAASSLAEAQSPCPALGIFGQPRAFALHGGCRKGAGVGARRWGPSAVTQRGGRPVASRGQQPSEERGVRPQPDRR